MRSKVLKRRALLSMMNRLGRDEADSPVGHHLP